MSRFALVNGRVLADRGIEAGLAVVVAWHPSALLRAPPNDRAHWVAHWLHDLQVAAP